MSLYQRKRPDGTLLSPYWYAEFEDEGKPVRKSTEVLIGTKSPKALERSKDKARKQEALIRDRYFKEKKEAAENVNGSAKLRSLPGPSDSWN